MVDTIKRRSALEHIYKTGSFGSGEGLSITERRPLEMFDIGGVPTEPIAGCTIPMGPNTVTSAGGNRLLWLSPNRWLLVSGNPDVALETDVIRNVSSGRTVLRLTGPNVRDVLAKGCPLDLHPLAFKVDTCAQSKISSLNVLIDHVDADTFDVYIARGFAQTFWEWLIEASNEYGYQVLP